LKDVAGKVICFEGTTEDITARKLAEEELKATLEKLRRSLAGTIQAMSLTVETRDPYTAGHQRRVANLARAIAQEMNLPGDTVNNIHMAGNIHDIGKISIPAEILVKPTKLTDIEMSLIKVHSQSGYDILKDVELPYPIAEMVLQHHERLDGSGYPQGLKGDQILLEARILCVADVTEAIASHRPYRPARGIEAALEEIEKNKGILYDAGVVEACIKLFREMGFKFE
jgi:HD-GYP domain-containing protein (c-di-GMP phosphodiesterase class II)